MKRQFVYSIYWTAMVSLSSIFLCGAVYAETTSATVQSTQTGVPVASYLAQVIISLTLIIALIIGMIWIMRKITGISYLGGEGLRIVASLQVGQKERLLVVQVGEKQILVGVTQNSINTIYELEKNILNTENRMLKTSAKFSDVLKNALVRNKTI